MLGGKSQSQVRPVALGSTVSSSAVGSVIPVTIGRTKTPMYCTWLRNVRSGGSEKTAKKILSFGLKKHSEGNVANIEYLLGHNPVLAVLQMWGNQNDRYPLNFVSVGGVTVADVDFYAVVGVTRPGSFADQTFTEYGAPGPVLIPGADWELPLWNGACIGPDPTNPAAWRYNSTDVYHWTYNDGNTIEIQSGGTKIYYAQVDRNGAELYNKKHSDTAIPISALRLTFEPIMGDGPQFQGDDVSSGEPLVNQRIYYPAYAGLSSPNLDLGKATSPPDLRPEVLGAYPFFPTGDALFTDMFEAIIKQGPGQVGFASVDDPADLQVKNLHNIQWGLGCYDFPGTIQRKRVADVDPFPHPLIFDMPNQEGNILIAVCCTFGLGAGTLTISDTAGNDWTPICPGGLYQVWYAIAKPFSHNIVTLGGFGYNWNGAIFEIGGVDTVDSVVFTPNDGTHTYIDAVIDSTLDEGLPGYLMAIGLYENWFVSPPDPLQKWNTVQGSGGHHYTLFDRRIYSPGEYKVRFLPVFPFNPSGCVLIALKQSEAPKWPKPPIGNFIDEPSMNWTRIQCMANGLYGSLSLDSQATARDMLNDLLDCMNARAFWSGSKLKVMPRSEVSAMGWGTTYRPPTAGGPIVIKLSDFVGDPDKPHYTIENKTQVDIPNTLQIQHPNRDGEYNDTVTSQPEAATAAMLGPRKDSPKQFRMIQDPTVGRRVLKTMIARQNFIDRHIISFNLNGKFDLLEPSDFLTIPGDIATGLTPMDVILTEVEVDGDTGVVKCKSEPFVYGAHAPQDLPTMSAIGYGVQTGADPGPINTPIMFEPVPRMLSNSNQLQLWLVVSAPGLNYGGCVVYMSTDGGTGYEAVGTILGNATTGFSTAPLPHIFSDVDPISDLPVDLTESNGILNSFTVTEEDAFLSSCYLDSAVPPSLFMALFTDVDYEVVGYAQADLTATSKYTIRGSGGNHLRRGVFGAQFLGVGSDHVTNSRFAFLGNSKEEQPGIFKLDIDPKWYGHTVYFKFCQFNKLQGRVYPLSTATPYPYTFKIIDPVRTVFGDYTVQPGDGPLQVNAANGPVTVTLPPNGPDTQTNITKVDGSTNGVTIAGGGTAVTTTQLTNQYDMVGLQSAPSGWTQTTPKQQNQAFSEKPTGTMDGTNQDFNWAHAPNPPESLKYYRNGIIQVLGLDYTLTGTLMHLLVGPFPDASKDEVMRGWYDY